MKATAFAHIVALRTPSVPLTWSLRLGSAGLAGLRIAGMLFWLAGGVVALLWFAALVHEQWVWGQSVRALLVGGLVVSAWCWHAWRTCTAWRNADAALTLSWRPPARAGAGTGEAQKTNTSGESESGGFKVAQWDDAPVKVQVIVDLQRWMLLRLVAESGRGQQAWVWIDTVPDSPDLASSMQRLRTLLYMPSPVQDAGAMAPHDGGAARSVMQAMASWAHIFKLGNPLRPSVASSRSQSAAITAESSFPPTQIMLRDDGCAPEPLVGGRA